MSDQSPKRAVIYARQSLSRDPLDSLSIEFQERECREYIARQGWIHAGSYTDPDKKGWKRFRPGFDAMLAAVAEGKADTVVLFKLSRFARNLMMQEEVVAEIARSGGDLVSITEPHMSTSPMIRQILGAVNEHYRRDQADWLSAAFAARARKGLHHGYAPFGYRIEDGHLLIDETTGPQVRQLWEWALEGHGSPEITYRLNEHGIVTRNNARWQQTTVLRTLRNVAYVGDVMHRGDVVARDAHPAIVSRAEYDHVQTLLANRSGSRRKAEESWAEGFVVHACGRRMPVSGWSETLDDGTVNRRGRFRCSASSIRQERGVPLCTARPSSIFLTIAERHLVDGLGELVGRLATPERIAATMDRIAGEETAGRAKKREATQRKHDDLARQRDRLLTLVLEGKVDADLYRERDDALKVEIAEVAQLIADTPTPISMEAIRRRHAQLLDVVGSVERIGNSDPAAIVPLLSAIGAVLVVGDGAPYLRIADALQPYFSTA